MFKSELLSVGIVNCSSENFTVLVQYVQHSMRLWFTPDNPDRPHDPAHGDTEGNGLQFCAVVWDLRDELLHKHYHIWCSHTQKIWKMSEIAFLFSKTIIRQNVHVAIRKWQCIKKTNKKNYPNWGLKISQHRNGKMIHIYTIQRNLAISIGIHALKSVKDFDT